MDTRPAHYLPKAYLELDSAFIPAHTWPKTLIDLALARGQQEHKLLRNTGIFYEDIARGNLHLSPLQIFRLFENATKQSPGCELAFLLGRELLTPCHAALGSMSNLATLLDYFARCSNALSPLLSMHLHYENERLVIYWLDNFGADDLMPFLLAMMATSLHSFTRRHSGSLPNWTFYFKHPRPDYIEQYQVHLGERLTFNAQAHAIAIPRRELHSGWAQSPLDTAITNHPSHPPTDFSSLARNNRRAFLHEVYDYLHRNFQLQPNLEHCAQDFGMSSASLKRKLQKHRSSFQQQHDLVRKHMALHWLSENGITHEEIARQLHFYDAANLRRAFKRWTGQLPGKL